MQFSDHFKTSPGTPLILALLALHTLVCGVSLAMVLQLYGYLHLFTWSASHVGEAVLLALPVAAVASMMAFTRFSFGYLLSFYLFTITLGYVCLIPFSELP